jgi:hypothetical protein
MRSIALVSVALLVAGSLFWGVGADESKTASVAPETLLPASSCIYMTDDGSIRHLEGLKQTAAWKSLEDTQLIARILDLVQLFVSASGEANGQLARDVIDHVRGHGVSFAFSVTGNGDGLTPYGTLVLHDAGSFLKRLEPLILPVLEKEGQTVSQMTLDGRQVASIPTEMPGVSVEWWNEQGHLVISAGMNGAMQTVQTAMGSGPNITENPLWTQLRQSDRYTITSFGWMESASLLKRFGDMPMPPAPSGKQMTIREGLQLLGLHNLNEFTIQSGFRGDQTWSDLRINADGELSGLAKLFQQRNMTLADLPALPKATTAFAAWAFDLAASWDLVTGTVRNVMTEVEPESLNDFESSLVQIDEVFGGSLRDGLLAGLGDVWCVYNDPAPLPLPIGFSPVAAVSVKDKGNVSAGIARIMEILKQQITDSNVSIRHSEKDGRETYSFNMSGMPFVPTMMISDKWMAIGLTPGAIQGLTQRENGKLPSWKPDNKVQSALAELPTEFSMISVADPSAGYVQLMQLAPMGLNLLEQQFLPTVADGSLQMPFTAEDLPAIEEITDPMFPNVSVGWSTDSGFAMSSRQSVPSSPFGNMTAAAPVPILLALLLPAVQQAREAARRTQSKNNLKQLALAMHNYHDVFNEFPAGTVSNTDLEPDQRLSWGYSILPYIEQAALYQVIDARKGWQDETNGNAVGIMVPMFVNPSQPDPRPNPSSSDYVAMAGVGEDAAMLPNGHPKAGIFGYDRKCRISDITDGTSNTMMITTASQPTASFLAGGRETIRGFSQSPYLNGPDGIGSPHNGVILVLMADGSVRSVATSIEESVLEAIATKSGNEIVPDF